MARDFLQHCVEDNYTTHIWEIEEEKRRKAREARESYERLSPDEKQKRLMEGLYHWYDVAADKEEDESLGRS